MDWLIAKASGQPDRNAAPTGVGPGADVGRRSSEPGVDGYRVVDAVVVGGGIAGASVAWALAVRGASVVLVEQEAQTGHHATGRSAALLNETVGHPVVGALARASRPFLAEPPPGFVDHPLLAPRGLLWVGEDTAALDAVAKEATAGAVERLDATAAAALVPELRATWAAAGGVHEAEARSVDVAALLQAYVRGVRSRGGDVATAHEAVRLSPLIGGGWRVEAAGATLVGRTVVDAAGAWGDVVAGRAGVMPLGLTPLRRTACIVPVPDGHDVRGWPLIMDVAGGFYAEPEPGGLLVSPGDETPVEPGDARPDELDVALGLDRLREATTLPVRAVRRAWAGLRTFASDRAPVAGFDPDAP
ncbi:MAG: NAD(P)/FAD-dependent oxidoreductase, partial [Acidimicrobiales bacterium]